MNEDNKIETGISEVNPVEAQAISVKPNFLSKVCAKIPQKVKNLFNRFYSNKKVFWPITIAFGLIFMIIILGLLFGSKKVSPITQSKTPQPEVLATPEASESSDILSVSERKLKDLNNQINSLDLGQNKLKPPSIDYNVSFQ